MLYDEIFKIPFTIAEGTEVSSSSRSRGIYIGVGGGGGWVGKGQAGRPPRFLQ